MALHNLLGKQGEALAVAYLKEKDYVILHTNWRHAHYEIDIIAEKPGLLHFIEVKFRTSDKYGYPEAKVGRKKFQFLTGAADAFLLQHPHYRHIQFDILSIVQNLNKGPEYFLIQDIYL